MPFPLGSGIVPNIKFSCIKNFTRSVPDIFTMIKIHLYFTTLPPIKDPKCLLVPCPGADNHSGSGAGDLDLPDHCSDHRLADGGVPVRLSVHSLRRAVLHPLRPLQDQPLRHG